MTRHERRALALLFILFVPAFAPAFGPTLAWSASPNYQDHIKPLFRAHCLKCHNADEANADLDLSTMPALLKGGSSGPVVKAGRPASSQLYRALAHLDGAEAMPPESPKLSDDKLALVREWIRGGLLATKGGKSQLRSMTALRAPATLGAATPLPKSLPQAPKANTVRPPLPQAMAASPGAPLLAVSGQEQVLLYANITRNNEGQTTKGDGLTPKAPVNTTNSNALSFIGALPFPEGVIHDLKFSRDGSLLLAAGGRGAYMGKVVLYDVKTGKRIREVGDEVDSVLAADISADHQWVALGGPNKIVKVFSTTSGAIVHRIKKHTDWVTAIAFRPDGKMYATGDRSGGIHIWETKLGAIVFSLNEHKVRIADLSWRADGEILASGAEDGSVILWSMKDGFPVRNIVAHTSKQSPRYSRRTGVLSLNYAADGRLLTSGRDGSVRLWSADGQKLQDYPITNGLPISTSLLFGTDVAIVGTFDGSLQCFDLKRKSRTQVLSTSNAGVDAQEGQHK